MNQEKIMKMKMVSAIIIAIAAIVVAFIFGGLYYDQKKQNRLEYIDKYEENISQAAKEIDTYLEKKTDYDIHYNMILSDLGAARSLIFLVDDYTDKQKPVNELHYCFVKYPEQMKEKLKETSKALKDISANLDKGYKEAQEIVDSIDKKGK